MTFEGFPWEYAKPIIVTHAVVFAASLSFFAVVALRWRDFLQMSRLRQWLTMSGCWLVVLEGFAFCMTIT